MGSVGVKGSMAGVGGGWFCAFDTFMSPAGNQRFVYRYLTEAWEGRYLSGKDKVRLISGAGKD